MARILVVDDETISVFTLGQYLSESGYDVRTARSGTEALNIGLEWAPDLLLSDWKLQDEIDGLELCRRLSEKYTELKSIIFSGLSAEDVPAEYGDLNVYRFLNKPCGLDEVLDCVREALGSFARSEV